MNALEQMRRRIDVDTPPASSRPDLGPCWLWNGATSSGGYANVSIGGRTVSGHRAMYEVLVGPIPAGLHIDHLCRVRRCVNPAHMEPVPQRINTLRGDTTAAANAAKTHCPQGHPLSGDNLRMRSRGTRECRTCDNARQRARKAVAS